MITNTMDTLWKEGYHLEKNGVVITIEPKELRSIKNLMNACNGQGSVKWMHEIVTEDFECGYTDDDAEYVAKKLTALERLEKNERACMVLWENFRDYLLEESGDLEREVVEDFVKEEMYLIERENANNEN